MSRIHDALKKAEIERVSASGSVPVLPPHQVPARPAETSTAPSIAVDVLPPISIGSMSAGPVNVEQMLTGCAHRAWTPDPKTNVFFNPELSAQGMEQFRTLRSRLYQLRGNQPLRTVLITSAMAGEGKTFVSSNLAQAIVRQPDRRVLLIDADLRCSRLHVTLGSPAAPGLTNYLQGDVDEAAIIQRGAEDNLWFIPGGDEAPNPSELLANGRLKALLNRVGPAFDWVILDSPPCLPVADAMVLADFCDGVLLVVKAGVTPSGVVEKAVQELQGRNVVGVVLNAVGDDALAYGSYYNTSYYGRDHSSELKPQNGNGKK